MPDDATTPDPVSGEVVSEAFDGPGDWLPPADAARRIGVSERTLWRRVTAGQIQRKVVSGKALILVPVAGTTPNESGLAVPDAPDGLALAVVEALQTRLAADQERLTRQAEELQAQAETIGALRERAEALAVERAAVKLEVDELREEARTLIERAAAAEAREAELRRLAARPWWRWW